MGVGGVFTCGFGRIGLFFGGQIGSVWIVDINAVIVGVGVEVSGVERCLVAAAPVVFELTRAPAALELCLAGVAGRCIVEIPRVVVVHRERRRACSVVLEIRAHGFGLGEIFLALGSLGFLLFFLLEVVDDFIDDLHLLFRRHCCQPQQRVLKRHVLGIDGEFVEHVTALFDELVVGIIFGELGHCLGIAGLCVGIISALEIEASERQLAQSLVDARARRLLGGELIVLDGV